MPKPLFSRRILVVSPTPTYPLDFGNRNRIYEMTKRFQNAGAKVDFLYSPMEWNTSFIDFEGYRQMVDQWDQVFLVPSEGKYYTKPQGNHYSIDEWWEAPLHQMLEWLLLRQYYDCVVVNYAFLSKTLELIRGVTIKVLDTHDQLAGRKEILESLNLEPDFFYLTEKEEAKAFNRADIVIAIKDEEAHLFRNYTSKEVIFYPFPGLSESWINHGNRKVDNVNFDLLKVGFCGGLNQLNIECIRSFIMDTRDLFSQNVAPLEIKIGGSVCEAFEDLTSEPHVQLIGRYEEPSEFYSQCDLIINPMMKSTGLKIKTVEAINLGMPLLTTSHASEGIPERGPSLLFKNGFTLAKELVEVSFDRSRLEIYRRASNQAHISLQTQASKSFESISARINSVPTVVIISNALLDGKSDYRKLWLNTRIYYLRNGREICMATISGIMPSIDILKKAYNWQTECVKFIGEAGHKSADDYFFSASIADICNSRTSVTCIIADIPSKEQTERILPSLEMAKTILILEELCDYASLIEFMETLNDRRITPPIIVTSRLNVSTQIIKYATAINHVLPYMNVDVLRDFFKIYDEATASANENENIGINQIMTNKQEYITLSEFKHKFKSLGSSINRNILINEEGLMSDYSFILLMKILGFKFNFTRLPNEKPVNTSIYFSRFLNEDAAYIFSCLNKNDAGWCHVWSATQ